MAIKSLALSACLLALVCPLQAQQSVQVNDDELFQAVQREFAEAYNRKDLDAMAGLFAENGIRITPSGMFVGRAAIRRNLQEVLEMGLHDYTVRRTISHTEGGLVFHGGEWQAKLGDQQFRGYYSALLIREGGQVKIYEETVNVAAPGK